MQAKIIYKDFEKCESLAKDSFLQSKTWANFKNKSSWKPIRIIIEEKDKPIYMIQILKRPLPLGYCLLYAPYAYFEKKYEKLVLDKIKELARKENSIFFTLEAFEEDNNNRRKEMEKLGFKKSLFRRYQPEYTNILNISESEEEILKDMKPKGRYNIKLAQKKGVLIKKVTTIKDLKDYEKMNIETEKRDNFTARSFSYIKSLFNQLVEDNKGCAYIAYYKKEPLSGIIVSHQGKRSTYMYGASSNKYRNLMAPYLAQWTAIIDAKKEGKVFYDFFGTAPTNATDNHKWMGITKFKEKFGGKQIQYLPGYDLIFKPVLYRMLAFISKLRKVG
jgi:lipid II:glycine glycyltransferase (peptidoglycan interpeptide bridge formation enzyme)